MSKLTHLCLGACGTLVLVAGIMWTPIGANAAPGDPQEGPSGPTAASYGNEEHGKKEYNKYSYNDDERYPVDEHEEKAGHACEVVHKIVLGENLTTIAKSYGVSLEALVEANGITDSNLIVENQALCIPESDEESYGERESYDKPSNGPSNGQSEGPSNEPYMEPGVGYDPSTFNKKGGEEYGNEEDGKQEYRNEEASHEKESDVYRVPGKGYDPNESYEPKAQPQYEPQYSFPEREREPFDFDDDNPEDGTDPVETPVPDVPDTDTEPDDNG